MHYLSVDEIESGLAALKGRFPTLCRLVPLPNRTHEGRTVTALRIGKHDDDGLRVGVLFLAGIHAMEWGGSDCALRFATDLLESYTGGNGLSYGGTVFDAAQITSIVEMLDVVVVGCINPDGRAYSQQTDPQWRKNRRPLSDTDSRIGTDLNRNFDFLWDVARVFDPSVLDVPMMGSPAPASDHYRGRAPASEAETRNVVWLLDEFPHIGWLLDIHCNGGQVMHSWGDAPNQTTRPEMTFHNPQFDGMRGTSDVQRYGEYIDPDDQRRMRAAVVAVTDAVRGVRGQPYQGIQCFDRVTPGAGGLHSPMSGTTIDYAYSRHFVNPDATTVYGLAIEFGLTGDPQPPVEEMELILADVGAGMVALCLEAREPVLHIGLDPRGTAPFRPDFRILSGIIDGGPGWVWVDGRPVFVQPPDPRLHEMLRRVGEFQVAPEIDGRDAVAMQRAALEKVVELSQSLLDELG